MAKCGGWGEGKEQNSSMPRQPTTPLQERCKLELQRALVNDADRSESASCTVKRGGAVHRTCTELATSLDKTPGGGNTKAASNG